MTPKEQFLATPHAKAHPDLVASPAFVAAMNFAMLQFVEEQPRGKEIAAAWDAHSQLQGALKLKQILETLGNPPEPQRKSAEPTIDHSVYERRNRNA